MPTLTAALFLLTTLASLSSAPPRLTGAEPQPHGAVACASLRGGGEEEDEEQEEDEEDYRAWERA